MLDQALEQAYSCVLLAVTNYAPPSHTIKFLSLAEEQDRHLSEAFPRDQHRERAWFNPLTEALDWLIERAAVLISLMEKVCREHLQMLARRAE